MVKRTVLLNPGPVNVTDRVRAALGKGDFCHREPEISELIARVRARLIDIFCSGGAYKAVLVMGSGSAALEMAVSATVQGDDRLLVVNNGTYGDRISKVALAHGQKVAELHGPPTERPDLGRLESMLALDGNLRWIAVVHHETTTGLVNPIMEIARIARRHGRRILVDAISGLACDPLPIVELGLDLVVGTANKAIQDPGVSFVLGSAEALAAASDLRPTSHYLHLPLLLSEQESGSHPFTTAVQVLFAFDEALAELSLETLTGRILRMSQRAQLLRTGFEKLGLSALIPEKHASNALTSLKLPEGKSYAALHDALKARGFVIYAGQGQLATKIFRVANMGAIEVAELEEFLAALGDALHGGDRPTAATERPPDVATV
ncbi:MAG: aminotransferase class V-fold PLP-dependent enzyme [Acidobacteriota bacterium]